MRIIKYATELDEDRKISLVKESIDYYPTINTLDSVEKIVKMMNVVFHADVKAEEYVWVIALDAKCHVKGVFEVTHGGIDYSLISPREIFTRLCLCGATSFIVVHNHPSGITTPSEHDIVFTNKVKESGDVMNIKLLDHIIIAESYYLSMHVRGLCGL